MIFDIVNLKKKSKLNFQVTCKCYINTFYLIFIFTKKHKFQLFSYLEKNIKECFVIELLYTRTSHKLLKTMNILIHLDDAHIIIHSSFTTLG